MGSALPQNTPDFEFSSWIFFLQVGCFSTFRNLGKFFSPELYFYKKRKKIRETFLTTKHPRYSNFKSDFFPIEKVFSQIFENTEIFFHLKVISKKKKNQRNFFGSKNPRF